MKKAITTGLIILSLSACAFAGTNDKADIKKIITKFSKAGDNQNAAKLESFLDDNYRVIMNRLFGSKSVGILPKAAYLEKIKKKEFGGDTRKVTIKNITINGTSATAHVHYDGKKADFASLITFVQNEKGEWKIIADVPFFM